MTVSKTVTVTPAVGCIPGTERSIHPHWVSRSPVMSIMEHGALVCSISREKDGGWSLLSKPDGQSPWVRASFGNLRAALDLAGWMAFLPRPVSAKELTNGRVALTFARDWAAIGISWREHENEPFAPQFKVMAPSEAVTPQALYRHVTGCLIHCKTLGEFESVLRGGWQLHTWPWDGDTEGLLRKIPSTEPETASTPSDPQQPEDSQVLMREDYQALWALADQEVKSEQEKALELSGSQLDQANSRILRWARIADRLAGHINHSSRGDTAPPTRGS